MPKREKVRYNMDEIDKQGAQVNIIFGERSNRQILPSKTQKSNFAIFVWW